MAPTSTVPTGTDHVWQPETGTEASDDEPRALQIRMALILSNGYPLRIEHPPRA